MSTICHYKSSQRHTRVFDLQVPAEMQRKFVTRNTNHLNHFKTCILVNTTPEP